MRANGRVRARLLGGIARACCSATEASIMGKRESEEVYENFAHDFIRNQRAGRPRWHVDRILVSTDFSACSLTALEYAADLASVFGAELLVVHVEAVPLTPSELVDLTDGAADREVARVVEHLRADGSRCRGVIRTGAPAAEISKVATEEKAGLIVLGTHGRKGITHLLLGSVAEQVVRGAPCPVLTVRPVERHAAVAPANA
jgi:nucleotide-binding universal stress UspA family protein